MAQAIRTVEPVSQELIDTFIRECDQSAGWKIVEDSSQKSARCYALLFDSITNFLAKVKSTEFSVGLSIEDSKGVFQFGAKLEYFKNDTSDELPGNWGYTFTFNPDDFKDIGKTFTTSSNEFKDLALAIAKTQYGFMINTDDNIDVVSREREIITLMVGVASKAIRDWVDENSVSETPMSTEIKGKVVIEAMLENDKKVCSITPSGELKNIIKDDAAIEYKMEQTKD